MISPCAFFCPPDRLAAILAGNAYRGPAEPIEVAELPEDTAVRFEGRPGVVYVNPRTLAAARRRA